MRASKKRYRDGLAAFPAALFGAILGRREGGLRGEDAGGCSLCGGWADRGSVSVSVGDVQRPREWLFRCERTNKAPTCPLFVVAGRAQVTVVFGASESCTILLLDTD